MSLQQIARAVALPGAADAELELIGMVCATCVCAFVRFDTVID
jgi:hypothetical protein